VLDRYTWDRTAEGYLAAIDRSLAEADRDRLPIPEWFGDPSSHDGFGTDDLAGLYLA
jgi:hypothetical protein